MKVILKKGGGTLTVIPQGELDQHSSNGVRSKIDREIDGDAGIKRLVFDFGFVSFMDSSGIGVLLGRYKKIAERNGTIAIENARSSVDKVLKMSGIYSLCDGGKKGKR